ncbi:unnamed protein product [Timema podura]|uniref:SH3 domain-containing protein n=1 Tax=Timema podura TaxID=61482 RepID=A0ABN7P871_TIMPD|nr:unnamed protein product [Timema podura]
MVQMGWHGNMGECIMGQSGGSSLSIIRRGRSVENSRKVGNFKAHHADKEALVIVKGDNVRVVLDMSENQWCQLKLLAKQTGELVYLRGSVAPTGRAELTFWYYCKVLVANQLKLLHIKVKKYPATPADPTKNIPVLCCVDIKEDRPKILNSFTPQELDAIYGGQGQT